MKKATQAIDTIKSNYYWSAILFAKDAFDIFNWFVSILSNPQQNMETTATIDWIDIVIKVLILGLGYYILLKVKDVAVSMNEGLNETKVLISALRRVSLYRMEKNILSRFRSVTPEHFNNVVIEEKRNEYKELLDLISKENPELSRATIEELLKEALGYDPSTINA